MKITIIGCPGSGKSTLTKKMQEILKCDVLHLDKIYHIDNQHHITREELKSKVNEFALTHENWIIDGNYISTVSQRINLADTIILLDIDTQVCINNAINRSKKERQDDMAEGFDNSQLKPEFLEFIHKFKNESLPIINNELSKAKGKQVIRLSSYEQIDNYLQSLKNN